MPWKVSPVSEVRLALCLSVRTFGVSVSEAARRSGVSRRVAHKWLGVYDAALSAGEAPLAAVRVEPRDGGLAVFYCWKQFRALSHDQLLKGKIL